jgi:hypothetical protein
MAKKAGMKTKSPELKKGSPASNTQKTDSFQSSNSTFDHILHLHRTIGNQAVQRLFTTGTIQPKLRIGQPNDIYEQEADRVADEVMRMPVPAIQPKPTCPFANDSSCRDEEPIQAKSLTSRITPLVQRQPIEEEEEKIFQVKEASNQSPPVSPDLETNIQLSRADGTPLPKLVRAFFEPRFGHDLSQVRIHIGPDAAQMNRDLNAQAFTQGRNIYFGGGKYNPYTSSGKRLLAHELTHVVQQKGLNKPSNRAKKGENNIIAVRSMSGPLIQRRIVINGESIEESIRNLILFIDDIALGYRPDVNPRRALRVTSWDRGRRRYATRVLREMEAESILHPFLNVDELVAMLISHVSIQEETIEEVERDVRAITGSGYGPRHRGRRPRGLPASARQASAGGEAYDPVERLSTAMATLRGWSDRQINVFTQVIMELAHGESEGTFGLPARNFPASTAWGVFQWYTELWQSTLESWGEPSPSTPWEASQFEEIEIPIRRYAELFEEIGLSTPEWAAYGLILWHATPREYNSWLRRARRIGFARAEQRINFINPNTGERIQNTIRRRLRNAEINIPSGR